jgi:Xaa-Pro aminopeptidase
MGDGNRMAWLQSRMAERGVESMAAFATELHSFQGTNPVRVLSGFKNMGDAAVILDVDGGCELIVSPAWDGARAREQAAECRIQATDDFAGTVAKKLKGGGRVGIAGLDDMPERVADLIREACAGRSEDMTDEMVRAGRCKTPVEIAKAREVAVIAEKVFDRLVECARPGMHEFELASEIYRYSKELGADDNFLLMSSSQIHKAPRPPGRRVLAKGDLILGEISPGADGQFVQICRTAVLGPIRRIQQKEYDILWSAMEAGMAAALPGRTVAQVAAAMNDAVARAGYADYCGPPYFRVRGHGLGNISHLPGDMGPDNHTELEEGMMFVMHPNQYLPGSGYMFCGESVVITPGGADPLPTRLSKLTAIDV